jgi:hypothetical protein
MDLGKVMVKKSELEITNYAGEIFNQNIPHKALTGLVLWNFNV